MTTRPRLHSPATRKKALKLVKKLGSVAEAARQLGVHRSTLHTWKRRKAERGDAGLMPLPPVHATHPQTTPDNTVQLIKDLALAHPSYGCYRLWSLLPNGTKKVSTTTVQNILKRNGLGTKKDRWLVLEAQACANSDKLSEEQTEYLKAMNPCFPTCNVRNQGPGWALVAGFWKIPFPDTRKDLRLCSVLDTWTGYVFGRVAAAGQERMAFGEINHKISRFYSTWGSTAKAIYVSDNPIRGTRVSSAFFRSFGPYALLEPSVINREHPSCCLKRFQRIVAQECFVKLPSDALDLDIEAVNASFQKWLQWYNVERKHDGCPHYGRTPFHRFNMRPKYQPEKKISKTSDASKMVTTPLRGSGSMNPHARDNSDYSKPRTHGWFVRLMTRPPDLEVLPSNNEQEPDVFRGLPWHPPRRRRSEETAE